MVPQSMFRPALVWQGIYFIAWGMVPQGMVPLGLACFGKVRFFLLLWLGMVVCCMAEFGGVWRGIYFVAEAC